MKKNIVIFIIACFITSLAAHSQTITISAEGIKQGKFKGESTKSKFSDRAEIKGYVQEVSSSHDVASARTSGRRTHQPVMILKESGASSPQFFQALTSNEMLKKVVIDFYKADATGAEVNHYTVTLENVSVSGFKQFIGPLENEKFNPGNTILYDEIKLTFQKITIEDKIGKTMAIDDGNIK